LESRDTPDANPLRLPRFGFARGDPKPGFMPALVTMESFMPTEESIALLMLDDFQELAKFNLAVTNLLLMLSLRVNAGTA